MELKFIYSKFFASSTPLLPTVLWILVILFSTSQSGFSQKIQQEFTGADAHAIVPGADYVKQKNDLPFPVFVRLAPGQEIPETNFFQWLRTSRRSSFQPEFKFIESKEDELGSTHTRYVQTINGVPVDQSHFIVHAKAGKIYAFNGLVREAPAINVRPALSEDQALQAALNFVGASTYMWQDALREAELKQRKHDISATHYPVGELVIVMAKSVTQTPRLAYVFDISALSPMMSVKVCVDAMNGKILYDVPMESNCSPASVNTIFNGNRSISTDLYTAQDFRLRDDCTPAVIRVRDWNSLTTTPNPVEIENTTNTWTTMNEIFGGTTLWCVEQAYSYFLNRFSRDAYDDANGDVEVYINALFNCSPPAGCTSANNASMNFSTQTMKVGLSSAGVLTNSYATVDIIGHEYTHAVTAASAGLVYENEWGALNESFSDIFGEATEFFVLGANDWLIGDERDNNPIRSMIEPNDTGDPDTYEGTNWFTISPPCDGDNDQCGVHRNSGVQNYWFYLVSDGGNGTNDNGDDFDVNGVGILAAEAIAYRNLTVYLGANSDYADARDGSIQAAIDLYGLCSEEVRAVMDAWYAVGIGDPFLNVTATATSDYNGADVSCFGAVDGEATADGANGTAPYSYAWSNGQLTAVATGLAAGAYTVTVTDANGCTATDQVTLTNPPMLSATVGINSDYNGWPISCFGACDGIAEALPTGGVSPYTYKWSLSAGGQETIVASGLCAGLHSVTVKDANGCITVADITLLEPPPVEVEAGPNQTIFYYDLSMACTTLMASGEAGGVPPYTYSWSSGGNSATENVCLEIWEDTITIVTYYVTLTDANGCTAVDSLDVCYVDINCGKNPGPAKVTICHIPPDNPTNPQTLCVSLSSLLEHLSHGDQVAECGFISPCDAEEMPFRFIPDQAAILDEALEGKPMLEVFPNPVTGESTVRFILNEHAFSNIQLYDMHGKLIRTLYSGEIHKGEINDVRLDRSDFSPGIYLVRLDKEGKENQISLSRKVVIE